MEITVINLSPHTHTQGAMELKHEPKKKEAMKSKGKIDT